MHIFVHVPAAIVYQMPRVEQESKGLGGPQDTEVSKGCEGESKDFLQEGDAFVICSIEQRGQKSFRRKEDEGKIDRAKRKRSNQKNNELL